MTWHQWQRFCSWAALGAGIAWSLKFVWLLATDGEPGGGADSLTGFVLPTLGSILGLVAAFGVAAPLVAGRKALIAVPVTVVTALVVIALVSGVSNAVQEAGPVADSDSIVVRTETAALVSGLLWFAVAAWLIARKTPGRRTPAESTAASSDDR